jgi:hypothetical protein
MIYKNKKFILFLVLFILCSKAMQKNFQDLLSEFTEPNKFISQAINYRKELFNENEFPLYCFESLFEDEKKFEMKAFSSYFNVDDVESKNIEDIFGLVKNKFDNLIHCLQTELEFNFDNTDDKSYHHLHFTINNFNNFNNKRLMTDNHSSKLFLENSDTIFLGDLCMRHLNVDEVNFNFLKYWYLFLYELTKQAIFKKQLKDNNIEFKDLHNFYSLGNHDCSILMQQDILELLNNGIGDTSIWSSKLYKTIQRDLDPFIEKIDIINRFLIPAEIVFDCKETPEVYVFSHSGGMFLLPDNTQMAETQYRDFSLKTYNYSYNNFSIQRQYNKLSNTDAKDFVCILSNILSETNNQYNPFIWCDFFTNIKQDEGCTHYGGRYNLMDIFDSPILQCLFSILQVNYSLFSMQSLKIFRGHEHDEDTITLCFAENDIYRVCSQGEKKIDFFHLPPVSFDNAYVSSNIQNRELDKTYISSIQDCLKAPPHTKPFKELRYRRLFMIIGLVLPFICMNIEKSGVGNIMASVGISLLSFLLIDRLSIDKKINIHTSIFLLAPISLSVLFFFINNKN